MPFILSASMTRWKPSVVSAACVSVGMACNRSQIAKVYAFRPCPIFRKSTGTPNVLALKEKTKVVCLGACDFDRPGLADLRPSLRQQRPEEQQQGQRRDRADEPVGPHDQHVALRHEHGLAER